MARLDAHGLEIWLPDGWEGRVYRRPATGAAQTYPVAHFATFPLPADVADFGGGLPTTMGPSDIFVVLFEYSPESVGTSLFARRTFPRPLPVSSFHPYTLRRGVGGQSGTQWFFTQQRRPFTLYVVLGSHAQRVALVARVNRLLDQITVHPVPVAGAV